MKASFSYPCSKLKLCDQSIWTFLPWLCFLQIPVFQRGGTVIPLKTMAGKSTEWMIDISYELRVALDTEVLWDDSPFTKLPFIPSDLFKVLDACSISRMVSASVCPVASPPLWEGSHLPPTVPLKWDYLSIAEAEHFSDISQPSSSPLEEEAENEQATNFLLDTEKELPTTVFSSKQGDTWHPHQFTKPHPSLQSTLRAGLPEPSRDTSQ